MMTDLYKYQDGLENTKTKLFGLDSDSGIFGYRIRLYSPPIGERDISFLH